MEAAPGCGPGTCNGCASSNLVLHPNLQRSSVRPNREDTSPRTDAVIHLPGRMTVVRGHPSLPNKQKNNRKEREV